MRLLRVFVLGCALTAGGCALWLEQRIRYDLAASVVGVVDRSNIRGVVGDEDGFPGWTSARFWSATANDRGQLLRVRLTTSKDLVSFANRKGVLISPRWHFCDQPRQAVHLGMRRAYVHASWVPAIPPRPSPVIADRQGRFAYDAILYVRHAGTPTPLPLGDPEVLEPYDLERKPRDVCVWVLLATKLRGFRTNVAKIPKEQIAAALGVEVGGHQQRQ